MSLCSLHPLFFPLLIPLLLCWALVRVSCVCEPLSRIECNALIFIFILKHKIYFHVLLHLLSFARVRQPFSDVCVCSCGIFFFCNPHQTWNVCLYRCVLFTKLIPFDMSLISSHAALIRFRWFVRALFFIVYFFCFFSSPFFSFILSFFFSALTFRVFVLVAFFV